MGATVIASLLGGALSWWRERSQHKAKLKEIDQQAQINQRQARAEAAGKLDHQSRDNITWEDGYLILLFTLPLLLLFFAPLLTLIWPEAQQITQAVMAGFEALKATPVAYQGAIGLIFVYVFGFRRLLHRVLDNWAGLKTLGK